VKEQAWKLADFGITTELTSTIVVTLYARGTPGYRAPELLIQGKYTNKVDIWGVGCILHELVTGEKAFATDSAVWEHSRSMTPLDIKCDDAIDKSSLTAIIQETLHVDPTLRPSAPKLFSSFSRCYDLATANQIRPDLPPFLWHRYHLMKTGILVNYPGSTMRREQHP